MLAQRFARALAIPTISEAERDRADRASFDEFHSYLIETFPLVHEALRRERIGDHHALLFTWIGTDPAAEPWLLVSHQDVVGTEPGTEQDWSYPPFGGTVADGFIWGRGAIDLKVSLVAALEAAEHLIACGFQPRRTVYFAFGADEEVGGECGGALIAAELRRRGVTLAFTLDEGGMVVEGAFPGVTSKVAYVGTAEKGYATLQLTCRGEGGHSSMPARENAATRLIRVLHRINRTPMPAALDGPTREMLVRLASHARQPYGALLRNLWLTAPLLIRQLTKTPVGNASVRSTIAVTMAKFGVAENVLPQFAEATVNVRLKPGDQVVDAVAHLERIAAPDGVDVTLITANDATPISACDGETFQTLASAIAKVMPGVVTAPFLTINGTDSHYFTDLAANQYRFIPVSMKPEDLDRIHGVDERISIEDYERAIQFYIEFIRLADSGPQRMRR